MTAVLMNATQFLIYRSYFRAKEGFKLDRLGDHEGDERHHLVGCCHRRFDCDTTRQHPVSLNLQGSQKRPQRILQERFRTLS